MHRAWISAGIVLGVSACSATDPSHDPGQGLAYPERPPPEGKADAWNAKNDPKSLADFLKKDLEYRMDALPQQGRARSKPWPEWYWPTDQDGPNDRWHSDTELSPLEKYDVVFNGWKPSDAFMQLKPLASCGEPFDKPYYEKLGPASKWWSTNMGNIAMRNHYDDDHDGEVDECSDNDGVEGWWGLCHAWTPASLNEPEPMFTVEYNGVTFYPSDIKALMIAVYDQNKSIMLGGRCDLQDVKRDEHGRILDDNCRDTNAGAFHVVAANLLGRYQMGFVEDRTYDYQVWNQPVYDFKVDEMNEIDAAKANELLGTPGPDYAYNTDAKRFWEVHSTLRYVFESNPSTEPLTPKLDNYLSSIKYYYIVEGDADGKIIGGEWITATTTGAHGSSYQPDFLWVATGPKDDVTTDPYLSYANVRKLLEKALVDPNQPEGIGGVCAGRCLSGEAQMVDDKKCFCDSACFSYGDCCDGRQDTCGGPPAGSCAGHCGETDAAPGSVPPDLCYCDAGCAQAGNCCADYAASCN